MAKIVYLGFDIGGIGGISTYSRYQIECLRASRHDVVILSVDRLGPPALPFPDTIHIRYSGKLSTALHILHDLVRASRGTDCVIVNHVNLSFFAYVLKVTLRIPYILNVYNIDILRKLNRLYTRGLRGAKCIISDCLYTISKLPDFHTRISEPTLLYDPVDIDFYRPKSKVESRELLHARGLLPDLADKFVLITVAVMRENTNKGHRLVIESLFRDRSTDIVYLIAGSGALKPAIEELSVQSGLSGQVIFLGYVETLLLPSLYSAADVCVLVSRAGDGFGEGVPLGLLEAMACEKPIICGNQDGSLEAVDAGDPNGIPIDPNNVDELISAIQALKRSTDIGLKMGKRGRRLVEEKFSLACMHHELDSILLLKFGLRRQN